MVWRGFATSVPLELSRNDWTNSETADVFADDADASDGCDARGTARQDVCAQQLLEVPFDRQGQRKPAQDRAAVPDLASALPDRNPRGSPGRGHLDRPSDD